jgi:hypothetical protein
MGNTMAVDLNPMPESIGRVTNCVKTHKRIREETLKLFSFFSFPIYFMVLSNEDFGSMVDGIRAWTNELYR